MQTTHLNLGFTPISRRHSEPRLGKVWEQCGPLLVLHQSIPASGTNPNKSRVAGMSPASPKVSWTVESLHPICSVPIAACRCPVSSRVYLPISFCKAHIHVWAESIYHFVGFSRVDIPNATYHTSLATFLTYLQLSWGTHATPARASDEHRLHHDLYNDSTRYSRYSYKELL